jgi:hypothetical protein
MKRKVQNRISSTSKHPLYPISIRGGGDYRGIYDIGFKRGFMGYRGLLLNAPYKIDRLMWMSLMMIIFTCRLLYYLFFLGG